MKPLNARQREVLGWVVDGCPDGVMEGSSHKISALALQSRQLVVIARRGGGWAARATEAGTHYHLHDRYPEGIWRRKPRARTPSRPTVPAPTPAERVVAPVKAPTPKPVSATQMLIDTIVAAGGRLDTDRNQDGVNWPQRATAAIRHGKVPDDKLLVVQSNGGWGKYALTLENPPPWLSLRLDPIAVPKRLTPRASCTW